jgi:hypothetical protein
MTAVRALQRRVVKLEAAVKPRPSPFVRWYGSFDEFVVTAIWPGVRAGTLAEGDMLDIIEALCRWETDGTWDRAHAS